MKKFLCILLAGLLVCTAGCAPAQPPQLPETEVQTPAPAPQVEDKAEVEAPANEETAPKAPEQTAPAQQPQVQLTPPVTETPAPAQNTCTLRIDCHVLLDKLDTLPDSVRRCVPANGILLSETDIAFAEGETAFDVLLRMTREKKVHLEFAETPAYGSIYVEGIGNLYEFDAGEMSGWLYHINGTFPSYASSEYKLQPGDVITFVYTCDLGRDVGGYVEGV